MEEIRCNQCGKLIKTDYLKITKEWGYFSGKDLEIHEINLCEECYDAWIQGFQIPVTKRENTEVLGAFDNADD